MENHTRFKSASRQGAVLRTVAEPGPVDGERHTWTARTWEGELLRAEGHVVVRSLARDKAVSGRALTVPPIKPEPDND